MKIWKVHHHRNFKVVGPANRNENTQDIRGKLWYNWKHETDRRGPFWLYVTIDSRLPCQSSVLSGAVAAGRGRGVATSASRWPASPPRRGAAPTTTATASDRWAASATPSNGRPTTAATSGRRRASAPRWRRPLTATRRGRPSAAAAGWRGTPSATSRRRRTTAFGRRGPFGGRPRHENWSGCNFLFTITMLKTPTGAD